MKLNTKIKMPTEKEITEMNRKSNLSADAIYSENLKTLPDKLLAKATQLYLNEYRKGIFNFKKLWASMPIEIKQLKSKIKKQFKKDNDLDKILIDSLMFNRLFEEIGKRWLLTLK